MHIERRLNMLSPQECYEKIYNKLISYDTKLKEIEQKVQQAYQLYIDGCNEIDIKFKDDLDENAQLILKVNAFIDIAKAHTSDLNKSALPIPFDSGSLSRLTVQIDNSSKNDVHATQLYKEATGQLMFLEQQKGKIKGISAQQKLSKEKLYYDDKAVLESTKKTILSELAIFFDSNETVNTLSSLLRTDGAIFGNTEEALLENIRPHETVSVGLLKMPIPTDDNIVALFAKKFGGFCDIYAKTINIPIGLAVNKGNVFVAEYSNDNENTLLSGIRNFILNVARYYDEKFDRICFIDPVRFSNNTLGCVSALAEGDNSFIDAVPLSIDEIRKKIKNIIEIEVDEERVLTGNYKKKIYVFHDFPQAYDSEMVTKIQQICVNAEYYEAIVILTHSLSSKGNVSNDSLTYIQSMATNIICYGQDFKMKSFDNEMYNFKWYEEPQKLPDSVVYKLIANKPVIDKSNDYIKRIGITELSKCKKGVRKIENIPYGIDEDGNILSLDFENTNFATYICGAARSGKSTLIHTIITGILQSTHPDNVEIWLVDFGKTEFSRYVNKNIPHIRYIILDESPELVYDLVDRLTEIMLSRQNKFMGKWEKLSDVPEEQYMPELFVVIDEFSIMSNILASSVTLAKEDYRIKLQTVLAKSAKLGMRFIFSSQGFTEGTRGLTEMAKDQIQQRIAMKADYSDIKSTLDLKTISERDELLMEQLPVHYALKRIPLTEQGDRLSNAHVLYIPNADYQIPLIESINRTFAPQKIYDSSIYESYIYKRPMIKDGNAFEIFEEQTEDITEHINKVNVNGDEKNIVMFIGSPQRMLKLYPIELVDGFCENCLLVAPTREKTSGSSLIMSAVSSLKMQGVQTECWTSVKNPIYRQITTEYSFSFDQSFSKIEDICMRISQLKKAIEGKIEANTIIFIMNYETIMMDMQYLAEEKQSDSKKDLSIYEEYGSISRAEGEADVNSFLASLELDMDGGQPTEHVTAVKSSANVQFSSNSKNASTSSEVYDARNDLKYILTHGPRWGYHFIMQFDTCGDFRQTKLDESLFRHRIMFQTAKSEAAGIVSSSFAESVSNLTNHIFRYTNGIEEVSFRPYLHDGLCIDGWSVQGQKAVNTTDEEDYLE